MVVPGQDEGAVAAGNGRHQMVVHKEQATDCSNEMGGVLVRLYAMAKAAIVAAPPGEHPPPPRWPAVLATAQQTIRILS